METSRNWRVRFKRKDGYFCFKNIKKKSGEPLCRQEVEEWSAIQLERNPDYDSVSEIINEDTEEVA